MAKEKTQFCTFYIDNLFFGIEVGHVQEVLRYEHMTAVPLASDVVKGLINLRGLIVPAVDLRRRLGYPSLPEGKLPMNVVVKYNGEPVSLLVDEIGDVFDVDENLFEAPPETLTGKAREVIVGAYKLEGSLLHVLNVSSILEGI